MESKWSENGVKIEPKTNEKRVKNQVEIRRVFLNSCQVSKRFLDGFTCLFQELLRHFLEIPEDFH